MLAAAADAAKVRNSIGALREALANNGLIKLPPADNIFLFYEVTKDGKQPGRDQDTVSCRHEATRP